MLLTISRAAQAFLFAAILCGLGKSGSSWAAEPSSSPKGTTMKVIELAPVPGDNAPAIQNALQSLGGGGTLLLSPGRYLCLGSNQPTGHPSSIGVDSIANVTLDGRGATLVGRDLCNLIQISNSTHVTVKNLVIDWDPLPHTSGHIAAIDEADHAFDIEPLVPARPAAGRITQGILAYNPKLHRLADNGWEIYQTQGERDKDKTLLMPDGRLRIFQRKDVPLPKVGWDVVVRHQVYGYNAFSFAMCSDVAMEDVTILAVPGMGVIGWHSKDLTIRRIRVVPSEGRWMSTTADAMHFNACRGTIRVEDSEFAGMGDDAINIHAMYGLATEWIDDHTLAIGRARMNSYYDKVREIWDLPAPGDVLEYGLGDDQPLIARGQLVVVDAHQDPRSQRTLVRFRDPLKFRLQVISEDADPKAPRALDDHVMLWNLSTSPAVRISGCKVHGNRARGFLLQTRDVSVTGCRFEDVSGAGIQICTDAAEWCESLGSRDVLIQECTFRRCNFGVARRAAALDLFSDLKGGRQSDAGVHQGLKILDNTFDSNTGAAINIGSSDGVDVRHNHVTNQSNPAVIIDQSKNVVVEKNQFPPNVGVRINSPDPTNQVEGNP